MISTTRAATSEQLSNELYELCDKSIETLKLKATSDAQALIKMKRIAHIRNDVHLADSLIMQYTILPLVWFLSVDFPDCLECRRIEVHGQKIMNRLLSEQELQVITQ